MANWSIGRYSGDMAEVEGINKAIAAAFGEAPYTAEELHEVLRSPLQDIWLAKASGQVIGFLAGLHTHGLSGPRLEADLLAVLPEWRGQGIASRMLAALRQEANGARSLRGMIRPDNPASERAFAHAGFTCGATVHDLMLYHILGFHPRPLPDWDGEVRPLASAGEADELAALDGARRLTGADIWRACQEGQITILLALAGGRVLGGIELQPVQTVTYAGVWLETLIAAPAEVARVRPLLAAAAVEWAKARELEEAGWMIPAEDWPAHADLLGEGFKPQDKYRVWTASTSETSEVSETFEV